MILWEYVAPQKWGVLTGWELQSRERARLEAKLDQLAKADYETSKMLVHSVRGYGRLRKIKVRAQKVQLRPLLCFGPIDGRTELTFLCGAYERNSQWEPANAREIASQRIVEVVNDPSTRGVYEPESGPAN